MVSTDDAMQMEHDGRDLSPQTDTDQHTQAEVTKLNKCVVLTHLSVLFLRTKK